MTGPAITITAGSGITTSSSSNDVTVAVDLTNSALPHTIQSFLTDVNNSGTSQTDLFSSTIAANKLVNNGGKLIFVVTGTNNDATATVDIKGHFAGAEIYDSGILTLSGSGDWALILEVQRVSSTVARCSGVFSCANTTVTVPVKYTELTGQDFTTTNIFKVTATAGGGGGGSNDITAHVGKVTYQP